MTSRVIDGHRKQEAAASDNWNTMMTKSERLGGQSSHSQSSFINMHQQQKLTVSAMPAPSGVTQSARFVAYNNNHVTK